uniref:Uncharacterized protein n=1 Tax=Siphoviridae sp. ctDOT22 TaxID=2827812 RepID=A0A8S5SVJ8_9CAUD|nr:MAG TPA: hypothetical protein [Siphoviridae sp. ctDOT22]
MLLLENLKKTIQKIAEVLKLKADKTDIVQSDWAQTDVNNKAFIRNKPNITDLTKSTYINLFNSPDDLSSSFWKVSGDITRSELHNHGVNFTITPYGSLIIEYKYGYRDLGESRLLLGMPPGEYNYRVSGDNIWRTCDIRSSSWEFSKSLIVNDTTFPAGYTFKLEIKSTYQYYLGFQLSYLILYQVNSGRNVTLMPRFMNARRISYSSITNNLSDAVIYNTNSTIDIIPNLYLDYPQSITINLDSNTNLPEYLSVKIFMATDGGQITFISPNIKSAPEGLVMNKLGAYSVILKVGNSYIVRIHNPS